MGAFHSAFCLLDGVSDPASENEEDVWVGLKLEEKQDDEDENSYMMNCIVHIGIGMT
ncbi:hypothetical protein F6Y03_01410 [Bacillus megaterium]|nr:hypothetical protein [Priestia megaterium]